MAARRYSQFKQNRPGADEARPSPGTKGMKQPMFDKEMPGPYDTTVGPGGPDLNRGAKFDKVKAYPKKQGFC